MGMSGLIEAQECHAARTPHAVHLPSHHVLGVGFRDSGFCAV